MSPKSKTHNKKDQKKIEGPGNNVSGTRKMWTNISGEKKYSSINAGKLLAATVGMKKK